MLYLNENFRCPKKYTPDSNENQFQSGHVHAKGWA